ncbi:inversin-B-like isoform X2 [Centruroides sculpturatus]|uniref:inversin-B-like isoform X2 n=1 Tax=Centruroides sculpturatus TaxID=218467 RepID=UPI000C6CA666|nr:inversin-B-like isoform X2 [Centruroides sculpturatus]
MDDVTVQRRRNHHRLLHSRVMDLPPSQRPISAGLNSLMVACQQGLDHEVKAILQRKPSLIIGHDRTGKTPLHYCAENRTLACAECILTADPTLINVQDEEGYTALHLSVISGNKMMTKYLIRKGADINCVDNEKHSAIHWATVCGELACLDILMEAGAFPSTPDIHGAYPIHYAAQMCGPNSEMGNDVKIGLAALRKLLSWGVEVDVSDQDGRQPLLWAASAGSSDAILALVNAGANVHAEDKDGLTALHCAASRGHNDCIETLVTLCGAEVDIIDSNGCTALFYAVTLGHADCTQLLLKYGAEPNRQDRKGRTPAHCGAAKGQLETLKILSKNGANLWIRNIRGDVALHEAVQSGRKDLVYWLLESQPHAVNISNSNGRTSLHAAAISNNIEMCKVLMDWGAFINPIMRNSKGQLMTPLDAAIYCGNRGCAKYLQLHGAIPASKLIEKDDYSRYYINGIDLNGRPYSVLDDGRITPVSDRLESAVQTDVLRSELRDANVQVHLPQNEAKTKENESMVTHVYVHANEEVNKEENIEINNLKSHKSTENEDEGKTIEVQIHRNKELDNNDENKESNLNSVSNDKKGILIPEDSIKKKSIKKKLRVYVPEGVGEVKVIQFPLSEEAENSNSNKVLSKVNSLSPLSSSDTTVKDSGLGEDVEKIAYSENSDQHDVLNDMYKPVLLEIRRKRKTRKKLPDVKLEEEQEEMPRTIHERKCHIPGRDYNNTMMGKLDYSQLPGKSDYSHIKARVNTRRSTNNQNIPVMEKLQNSGQKSMASRSITQQIQQSLRKYQLERKLFQELQELKHHQIRSGRANESIVVKRLVERYRREVLLPGMRDFEGPYTYKAFEKYLYDQLRLLSSSNHGKVPRIKTVVQKSLQPYTIIENESAYSCTCKTHRCNHASQAYSGRTNKLSFPKPTAVRQNLLPAISPSSSVPSDNSVINQEQSSNQQTKSFENIALKNQLLHQTRSRSLDRFTHRKEKPGVSLRHSKSDNLPSYKQDIESLREFWRRKNEDTRNMLKQEREEKSLKNDDIPRSVLTAVARGLSRDSNPDDSVVVNMMSEDDSSKLTQTYTVQQLKSMLEEDSKKLPNFDPEYNGPVTFEVKHGKEKNVFQLPADKLKNNKKWQVTFTIGKTEIDNTEEKNEDK